MEDTTAARDAMRRILHTAWKGGLNTAGPPTDEDAAGAVATLARATAPRTPDPYAEEREQVRVAWNRLCAETGHRGQRPDEVVDDILVALRAAGVER